MRIDFIFEIIHPLKNFMKLPKTSYSTKMNQIRLKVEKPRILIINVNRYVGKLVRSWKSLQPLSLQFLVNF